MAGLATKEMNGKGKMMIGKIIGVMFLSRTCSHMAHLKTSSYAKHKALQKFYEGVVDLADDLAEAGQGLWGKLDIPFEPLDSDITEPIVMIQKHLNRIENLAKDCQQEFIGNILQEVQALYRKTLYLMTELN